MTSNSATQLIKQFDDTMQISLGENDDEDEKVSELTHAATGGLLHVIQNVIQMKVCLI